MVWKQGFDHPNRHMLAYGVFVFYFDTGDRRVYAENYIEILRSYTNGIQYFEKTKKTFESLDR